MLLPVVFSQLFKNGARKLLMSDFVASSEQIVISGWVRKMWYKNGRKLKITKKQIFSRFFLKTQNF